LEVHIRKGRSRERKTKISFLIFYFILTANRFLLGGSGTTIKHNTQKTHITQNNTLRSNKIQDTKLQKQ
jgi:hypothetical protein